MTVSIRLNRFLMVQLTPSNYKNGREEAVLNDRHHQRVVVVNATKLQRTHKDLTSSLFGSRAGQRLSSSGARGLEVCACAYSKDLTQSDCRSCSQSRCPYSRTGVHLGLFRRCLSRPLAGLERRRAPSTTSRLVFALIATDSAGWHQRALARAVHAQMAVMMPPTMFRHLRRLHQARPPCQHSIHPSPSLLRWAPSSIKSLALTARLSVLDRPTHPDQLHLR